jgi:hypothetical protein
MTILFLHACCFAAASAFQHAQVPLVRKGISRPLLATSVSSPPEDLMKMDKVVDENLDAVVCGGGPAGLLSAIMLAQKFPEQETHLYDSLSEPPSVNDE